MKNVFRIAFQQYFIQKFSKEIIIYSNFLLLATHLHKITHKKIII
jgi:hypothetical protein